MRLSGKTAIVTGGGRGIGQATAIALARDGARVVVAARSEDETRKVAEDIERAGGEALAVPADVTHTGSVENMVARTEEAFGPVDVLVNNAGVAIHNPIARIREEDWDLNIAVNLKGVFLCTQAVFAGMCERGSGHIVNVSSTSGTRGHVNGGAYCASKFGVIGFTQVTDAEGRPHGVKASVVCPGPTDTRMRRENHPDDVIANLTRPEEVADAILFLVTQPQTAHTAEVVIRTPLM